MNSWCCMQQYTHTSAFCVAHSSQRLFKFCVVVVCFGSVYFLFFQNKKWHFYYELFALMEICFVARSGFARSSNLVKSKPTITAEYFLVWYNHFICAISRNSIHYFIIVLLFVSCCHFIYKHVIVFFYAIYFSFFFSRLFTLYYCEHLVTFRSTLICVYPVCVCVFILVFNYGMHTFDSTNNSTAQRCTMDKNIRTHTLTTETHWRMNEWIWPNCQIHSVATRWHWNLQLLYRPFAVWIWISQRQAKRSWMNSSHFWLKITHFWRHQFWV